MRKNRLLIVLFTGVAVLLSLASCTYDYFEDETNYQVFVPEVLNKTVSDCRVLVYNDAGTLVGARYATSPWDKDPRMEAGLFSFRLTPGEYKVYCYTNTDSLTFVDGQHLDASAFILKSSSTDRTDMYSLRIYYSRSSYPQLYIRAFYRPIPQHWNAIPDV